MKDIFVRAGKTFIQGFLGALAITLPNSDFSNMQVLKSLLIGATAGGISAVMNLIINYLNNKKESR
jgi:hypothetical protein